MQIVNLSWLKSFEIFANVPDQQLQWFIDNSVEQSLTDGDLVAKPGEPLTGPHIIVGGELQVYMIQNGSRRDYLTFTRGDITGYLPYSRGKISNGYAVAVADLCLLTFPRERVPEMIKDHFELTQSFVHVMSNRVRDFTALQQQNEKMMALGKLSAGLSHELNNPASAISRDAVALGGYLKLDPVILKMLLTMPMDEYSADQFIEVLFDSITSSKERIRLSLKERMGREDEITDWLENKGVENAYAIADSFVDFNLSVENLESYAALIPAPNLSVMLNWISNLLASNRLVEDIQMSSKRIADLVNSVKNFTHMDRAQNKQFADIHIGIRNTLTMLDYKIRKGNIQVVEDYDETLPPVNALIGELNQVWTNIIDNAADAMENAGKGTLTIKTEKDNAFVKIQIIDDGPGIAPDVLPNIFDPFYTTKPMGKGTGLGLEVVHRIIYQHHGTLKVKSKPGNTVFTICLPFDK